MSLAVNSCCSLQPAHSYELISGSSGGSMYSSYNFDKFTETRSARVVNLLGDMLMRKYPNFLENSEVPLADLLEWELWPAYITIYGINLC